MAILAVTSLVSYERAKAESLGLQAKGGLMERGERMFVFGVGCLSADIFVPVLWVLFILISFTAIARFVKVWTAPAVTPSSVAASRPGGGPGRLPLAHLARVPGVRPLRPAGRRDGLRTPRTRTTSGAPVGRWRARRQEALSSRSGRTMRDRRRAHPHRRGRPHRRRPGRFRQWHLGRCVAPPYESPHHTTLRARLVRHVFLNSPPADRPTGSHPRPCRWHTSSVCREHSLSEPDRVPSTGGANKPRYLTYTGLGAAMGHMPEPMAHGIARTVAGVIPARAGRRSPCTNGKCAASWPASAPRVSSPILRSSAA